MTTLEFPRTVLYTIKLGWTPELSYEKPVEVKVKNGQTTITAPFLFSLQRIGADWYRVVQVDMSDFGDEHHGEASADPRDLLNAVHNTQRRKDYKGPMFSTAHPSK